MSDGVTSYAGYILGNEYIIDPDTATSSAIVVDDTDIDKSAEGYQFHEDNVSVIIPSVTRTYKIAWVSDLHCNADQTWGDGISEANWDSGIDVNGRKASMSAEGYYNYQLVYPLVQYLNSNNFDLIIFGGDIFDYISAENFTYINYLLSNLTVPYMYIRSGDHDYNVDWSGGLLTSSDANAYQAKLPDGGSPSNNGIYNLSNNGQTEVIVVGMNKSTDIGHISQKSATVTNYSNQGIPTIIATHVAYDSGDTSLGQTIANAHYGQVYCWSPNGYGNWDIDNDSTMYSFLRSQIWTSSSSVKAVLAGHVHTLWWDGYINAGQTVREHIFYPAYSGWVGVVTISNS